MMGDVILRMREWLFGPVRTTHGSPRMVATSLIQQIAHGGLRSLSDEQLMALVDMLLDEHGLRTGLRGNARFMQSVSRQYSRKRQISAKQRHAIYNILERAYPHNLAAELRNIRG
jgi:hypothetical protein